MSAWFEHYGYGSVADGLFIGAYPQDAGDVATIAGLGVTRVFNLVQDVEYQAGGREACAAALAEAGIEEARVEVIDFGNLLPGHIERAQKTVRAWLDEGEVVYLHCRAGMQRSATVAAAVVALEEDLEPFPRARGRARAQPARQPARAPAPGPAALVGRPPRPRRLTKILQSVGCGP